MGREGLAMHGGVAFAVGLCGSRYGVRLLVLAGREVEALHVRLEFRGLAYGEEYATARIRRSHCRQD
jgi:hypothetical protein